MFFITRVGLEASQSRIYWEPWRALYEWMSEWVNSWWSNSKLLPKSCCYIIFILRGELHNLFSCFCSQCTYHITGYRTINWWDTISMWMTLNLLHFLWPFVFSVICATTINCLSVGASCMVDNKLLERACY